MIFLGIRGKATDCYLMLVLSLIKLCLTFVLALSLSLMLVCLTFGYLLGLSLFILNTQVVFFLRILLIIEFFMDPCFPGWTKLPLPSL